MRSGYETHRGTSASRGRGLAWLAAGALIALTASVGSAQTLSAPSLSNASSPNENTSSSANPSWQRFSNTQTLSSGATSFQTRYFGNASADCGPSCGSRTETLTSNYTVSWTVNSPNIYRLQIDTRRTAGLTIGDDGSDGAQATMNNVTCTPSGGTVVSGACTLADPADNTSGSTSDVNVNQTNQIIVCGQSLGSNVAHSVNFQWSQTAFTPSTGFIQINMDEAAVRLGANNLDASNGAANYPGTGGRTQANDGHFVTVTATNLCGNGVIDTCGAASEQCDQGGANGTAGSCCTTSCTFKTAGTGCTDDGNVCTNDTCNGASAICQHPNNTAPCTDGLFCNGADTCSGGACVVHAGNPCTGGTECADSCNEAADNCFDLAGTPCTPDSSVCSLDQCNGAGVCAHPAGNTGALCRTGSGDSCDPDEFCNGVSPTCPADVVTSAGTVCNPGSGDLCDPDETCTGVAGQTCPGDTVSPGGTLCRAGSGDVCDPDETCTGTAEQPCPADVVTPGGTTCRTGSGDSCDPDETCTGTAGQACPADVVTPSGTTCRTGSGDLCDPDETCTGTAGQTCPADVVSASGTVCRPGSGDICDPDETCSGTATDPCPADVVTPSGTVCNSGSGDACDPDEACTGTAGDPCPADSVSGAFVTCRPSAGGCDVAENCPGIADQPCPADSVSGAFVVCRPAAGICDAAENCDGSGVNCPADGKSTAECRAAAGVCDLAESCDGVGDDCPADAKSTAVCRPSAGDCDVVESCDGVGDNCPADGFASSSTVCRAAANACDVAENCTGSSATCPADTGLPDGDSDTVCDTLDNCDTIPNPSQANGDADALGDACDPCTNIAPTGQEKAKMTVTKLLAPTGDEGLSFKAFFTNVPGTPTIDPVTNGMRILLVDSTGATPLDVTIPGGTFTTSNLAGWRVNGSGTSWSYKNTGKIVPLIQGIQKIGLKAYTSTPGRYKFSVKGKKGTYPVNTANLPLTGVVVIDVPFASTGQCGEAKFPGPVGTNPACVNSGGKTVKCK